LLDGNFSADFAALLAGHEASNVHGHSWQESKTASYCAAHMAYAKYL
jgi:hypothetical protein